MEEFDIMHSADKSVRLTNKRIIHDNGERQQEVLLEDYTGYAFKKQNIGNFRIRAIVFGLLTMLLFIIIWNDTVSYDIPSLRKMDQVLSINIFWASAYTIPFFISAFLFVVSLLFYLMGRRRYLEIKGKYNSLSIMVSTRHNRSINRFVQAIEWQHSLPPVVGPVEGL